MLIKLRKQAHKNKHISYNYIIGFFCILMFSIIFIENIALKNQGKNLSNTNFARFQETQSQKFKENARKNFLQNKKNDFKNLTIDQKKSQFISELLPIIQGINKEILEKRHQVFMIEKKMKSNTLNVLEAKILKKLFKEYKVKNNDILELKNKIDIVPVSLAIAQAAIESGWGTSRFALEGNAYFGQKTIGLKTNGIKPTDVRNPLIKIRAFDNLKDSVKAYTNNLNTHFAYKSFRKYRKELRSFGKTLEGTILVRELEKYSELGEEYIIQIQKIINENNLNKYDFIEYQSARN